MCTLRGKKVLYRTKKGYSAVPIGKPENSGFDMEPERVLPGT
jgi:hypothetical protein